MVEDAVDCVCREEVLQALIEMKTIKASGPLGVSIEFIAASGEVGIELCQRFLDRL